MSGVQRFSAWHFKGCTKGADRADASQVPERMVLFHENERKRSLNGKTDLLLLFPSFEALAR